jgi:flavin-dependent dehydrogenase
MQQEFDAIDAIIVGAGPAGCAAAYDLASGGRRVLLLEKRVFPRPKACACGLTRKALKALRYSVDPVVERVCEEIVLQQAGSPGEPEGSLMREADKKREVRVRTRQPICAMAVRERFDDFCLRQTLGAGRSGGSVTLRKIESIVSLRETSPSLRETNTLRASGVLAEIHVEIEVATDGGLQTLRGRVAIGADGSNGQMRRLAEALRTGEEASSAGLPPEPAWYRRGFALEAMVPFAELPARLPGGDAPLDLVFDFAPLTGGYGWLFPKGDHVNIGVGAFAATEGALDGAPGSVGSGKNSLQSVTRGLLAEYARRKLGVPALAGVTGQYLGMGGEAYVPRGRVLLTGDAAGLVDPLTGEGIHSAIVSGQAAAAAVLACGGSRFRERRIFEVGSPRDVAAEYARRLRPLQDALAFSARAARAFYAEPERGFRAMRMPLLRSLILRMYADGVPHTKLITRLVRILR